MKVYILQFDIQWLNPSANIERIRKEVDSIDEDVDLVVLPEMYLTGFCMEPEKAGVSEEGEEIKTLIQIATDYNVALIGSLTIKENEEFYNRVLLLTSSGIIGRYDKQYLYSPSGENDVFSIKHQTQLIEYKSWEILPQVCYDLRFPENVRSLPAPDVLIYMANWPKPRIHHWDALLKARAIENQCYVVACNRIGTDGNDWEYPGHSKVIKYDGSFVDKNENSVYQIDKGEMDEYRSKYQFLSDKKK